MSQRTTITRGTAFLVPVKPLPLSKSRLAGVLDDGTRLRLARSMLLDVLDALSEAGVAADSFVVTADRWAIAAGRERSIETLPDRLHDHNEAVRAGLRAVARRGYARAFVVAADLPLLTTSSVRRLLEADLGRPGQRVMGVATDDRGDGTNVLALSPPELIRPAYGPASFGRHTAAAAAADAAVRHFEDPDLRLDIDTPRDLDRLAILLRRRDAGVAVNTRQVLASASPRPSERNGTAEPTIRTVDPQGSLCP